MIEFVSKLRNLKINPDTETSLSKQEIDVLFAVLNKIFECESYPKKGTFILEGQKDGEKPFKIVEFEFPGGEQKNFVSTGRPSRLIAESVLYDVSTFGKTNGSAITYLPNTPQVPKLNTSNGRFLCAFLADNGSYGSQEIVYIAVAKTLAMLREEDEALQNAYDNTFFTEVEDSPGLSFVDGYIEDLFDGCSLPELDHWEEWYTPKAAKGELKEFF